ncbi:MAG: hypothetical protein AB8B48_04325, partial [Pseudomonadales bacterium]
MAKEKSELTEESLGFWTKQYFALQVGRDVKTVMNWLNAGLAPKEYEGIIAKTGDMFHFPIDPAPSADIIGNAAHDGIVALQKGQPKLAEAITAKALIAQPQWETGKPADLNQLELAWTLYTNGLAWVRNPDPARRVIGFEKLRQVRRAAHRQLANKSGKNGNTPHWTQLHLVSGSLSLVEFATIHAKKVRTNTKVQRKLISVINLQNQEVETSPGAYTKTLVAWNNCQFASMIVDDSTFIESLGLLHDLYPDNRMIPMLEDDPDTAAM